jgi:protein SCO1/2
MFRNTAIALFVAALGSQAHASDPSQPTQPTPAFPGTGVDVIEQLGASVPLDTPLRDHTGKDVTLGELLAGEIPTILTFNYSSCPGMCSLQLSGLVKALPELSWRVGQQFRIVTLVLDPAESPERVRDTRSLYVDRLPPRSDAAGWTFAMVRTTGDETPIRRIADAVGFHYKFIPATAEWSHPAALIFVSTQGRVTRYVHGVDFLAADLTQSITAAGIDAPGAAVGFLTRCLHWKGEANDYSRMGENMLRYAAAGFLVLVLSAFGGWRLVRRRRELRALGDRP